MLQRAIEWTSLAFAVLLFVPPAQAQRATPDPFVTPGAVDSAVTQATIKKTICRSGYARSVRPPEEYTERLMRAQLDALGLPRSNLRQYEEDHLIPLSLGGAPRDPRNLWLEPRSVPWGAEDKDKLEEQLHLLVCTGWVPLREAQQEIASDWIGAFIKYVWRNERTHRPRKRNKEREAREHERYQRPKE